MTRISVQKEGEMGPVHDVDKPTVLSPEDEGHKQAEMGPDDHVDKKAAKAPDVDHQKAEMKPEDDDHKMAEMGPKEGDHKEAVKSPNDVDHKKAAMAPDHHHQKKSPKTADHHHKKSPKTPDHGDDKKPPKTADHHHSKSPETPDHGDDKKSPRQLYIDQKRAAKALYRDHKRSLKANKPGKHDDKSEGPSAMGKLAKKFSNIARQFSIDLQEITQHVREAEIEFTEGWRPGGRFRKRFCFISLGKKIMKMPPMYKSKALGDGKDVVSESGHRCTMDYRTLPISEEEEACFAVTVPETNRSFTYDELLEATNWFSPESVLGEGGFGKVYKGTIVDTSKVVAVKQLSSGSKQGEREFRAEVDIISRIHHRHLVSLVGYCTDDGQRLLVYDFVPNGTLEQALHGKGVAVLDWATRLRIGLGSARGLAYLYQDCLPRIIHRDIKASNILLDKQWEAQVADFGLAKVTTETQTHVSTRVMGTFGYLAPEYALLGQVTDKSDVYSFGVVLLELITGRKPVDMLAADGEQSLVEWARPLLKRALEDGNVETLADPKLEGNYEEKEMFGMIEAAAACIRHSCKKRPKMVQVARAIETLCEGADLTQGVIPGSSNRYESVRYADDDEIPPTSTDMAKFRAQATAISTLLSADYSDYSSSSGSGHSGHSGSGHSGHSSSSVFSSDEQPTQPKRHTEQATAISTNLSSDYSDLSSATKSDVFDLTQSKATISEEEPALHHLTLTAVEEQPVLAEEQPVLVHRTVEVC